jgi:predicted transcriptional regulator
MPQKTQQKFSLLNTFNENDFLNKVARPKMIMLFINIENCKNVSRLAYDMNVTYSHTVKFVNIMKQLQLITTKKEGRDRLMEYTKKGREVQQWFLQGLNIINGIKFEEDGKTDKKT